MKKKLLSVLFGISLIVFASIRIASNNTIYYYTTSEAIENITAISSERIKLGGFVVSESVSKGSIDETNFEITDGNKTIKIVFDGFIPELFQDEMGVILDGYFENNIFYSDDMLVKHDNEYVSEDGETYDVENYSK
ncbi:MAG: cytochrome c maturation protein CcmE [Actinomycetota bacterium]|nr:cytochrome c maturation protein CcmE [Actinomycetota bacterium]